ncbi:TetR/AcrR family transcriptional regulator [Robiginitalea sp. SC105]|nr:TetR/AcrR family transcriptional regulator [Robiginitalea sp. SC105]
MTSVLETGQFPASVYKFCKELEVEESEFYQLFGSLESVREQVWTEFYDQTIGRIQKDKNYESYSNREKFLSFFYTFFEMLALNRSYVLFVLGSEPNPARQLPQLSGLRKKVRGFARVLIEEGNEQKQSRITQQQPALFSEGAWVQMLFLLRFWMKDDSAGFEKTDVAIEKSVNTIFDIFDNTPLERILDFGKFLYKEHQS